MSSSRKAGATSSTLYERSPRAASPPRSMRGSAMAEMHRPSQGRTARFRAALLGSVAILGLGLVAIEQPAWSQSSPPPANANRGRRPGRGLRRSCGSGQAGRRQRAGRAHGRGRRSPCPDAVRRSRHAPLLRALLRRARQGAGPACSGHRSRSSSAARARARASSSAPTACIVTNAHVAGDADKITVTLERRHRATRPRSRASTRRPIWRCSRSRPASPCPTSPSATATKVRVGDRRWSRSATRSASAARSRPASSRPPAARSAAAPMTTSCRSTPRSTAAIRAARPSTSRARSSASTPRSSRPRAAASASASPSPRTSPSR